MTLLSRKVQASSIFEHPPLTAQDILSWNIKGVGPKRAQALTQALGPNGLQVLASDLEQIFQLELLPDQAVPALHLAAKAHMRAYEIQSYLDKIGLPNLLEQETLQTLVNCWGEKLLPMMTKAPYSLLSSLDWRTVDKLAQRQNLHAGPERLQAACEAALYHRLDNGGHTLSFFPDIEPILTKLLGCNVDEATITKAMNTLVKNRLAHPHPCRGGWQPMGAARMEQDCLKTVIHLSTITHAPLTQPLKQDHLTDEQQTAVEMASTHGFAMITGGAGTGKTATTKVLCDTIEAQGRRVHLMALAARAATRITNASGRLASTIAGILVKLQSGGLHFDKNDVLIIDEASMVDLPLFWRLTRKLNGASLILVGDPGQLPPIGFGLTLHAFLTIKELPRVELTHIFRQAAETGIPQLAASVRNGHMPELPKWKPGIQKTSLLTIESKNLFPSLMMLGADLKAQGFGPDDIQIICPTWGGPMGIDAINAAFCTQRARTGATPFPGDPQLHAGDPVLWNKNDWERGLFNGSLGRIISCDEDRADTIFDGEHHRLTKKDAALLIPAYAMSIHKSQGSQWPAVIMLASYAKNFSSELAYTAITRAAKSLTIVTSTHSSPLFNNQHSKRQTESKKNDT